MGQFPSCFFGLESEADTLEWNARTLVTLWGPERSMLHEYSYRLWGGLVSSFYFERWTLWFKGLVDSIEQHSPFDQQKFDLDIQNFEVSWTRNVSKPFPAVPTVSVFLFSLRLLTTPFKQHFVLTGCKPGHWPRKRHSCQAFPPITFFAEILASIVCFFYYSIF